MRRTGLTAGWLLLACLAAAADAPVELTKDEQAIVELTNKERAKMKLPPLAVNARLMKAARGHAANMARQEKMEHVLDGKRPRQRAEAAGYVVARVTENLAAGQEWTTEAVMEDWMKSKEHRPNILDPKVTEIGVGLAKSARGEWYYAQLFARPER
jgi:uncharacterized protein YkwD